VVVKCHWWDTNRGWGKERVQQLDTEGSWKVYHLTGLEACLPCIVRQPPVSLKDANLSMKHRHSHNIHKTTHKEMFHWWWVQTAPPPFGCFAAGYEFLISNSAETEQAVRTAITGIFGHPFFPILPQKTDYSLMMVQRGIDRVRQGRPHWVLMIQSLWCNHFRFTWDQFDLLPPWVPVTHPHENTHMCLYTQRIAAIYQSVMINELELFKHTNTLRIMFSDSE